LESNGRLRTKVGKQLRQQEGATQDNLKRLCTEFGNRARRNSEVSS